MISLTIGNSKDKGYASHSGAHSLSSALGSRGKKIKNLTSSFPGHMVSFGQFGAMKP